MTDRVVSIADWKISRTNSRQFGPSPTECQHHNMTMDQHGFTVRCDDCKLQLSAYWVLEKLLGDYEKWREDFSYQQRQFAAERDKAVRLSAAQQIEQAWRSRKMVPCCPHCGRGIFPADWISSSMVSKEYELAIRRRDGGRGVASVATIERQEAMNDDAPDLVPGKRLE